jgi:hypothetical protein
MNIYVESAFFKVVSRAYLFSSPSSAFHELWKNPNVDLYYFPGVQGLIVEVINGPVVASQIHTNCG